MFGCVCVRAFVFVLSRVVRLADCARYQLCGCEYVGMLYMKNWVLWAGMWAVCASVLWRIMLPTRGRLCPSSLCQDFASSVFLRVVQSPLL